MQAFLAVPLLAAAFAATAAPYSVPNAGVTFDAPDGFTELSKEVIARKFPSSQGPTFVVANERTTTSIAADLKDHHLPADRLAEVKESFEKTFERIVPGIEWKDRRIFKMRQQDWILLEFTSRAVDTDIHNILLVTSHRGRMLVFNFNSTRGEFPSMERALRRSITSISLEGN